MWWETLELLTIMPPNLMILGARTMIATFLLLLAKALDSGGPVGGKERGTTSLIHSFS
jgi:hypothetical protein